MSAYPASSILKALWQWGQMISCMGNRALFLVRQVALGMRGMFHEQLLR
jgi:hypothetical protein